MDLHSLVWFVKLSDVAQYHSFMQMQMDGQSSEALYSCTETLHGVEWQPAAWCELHFSHTTMNGSNYIKFEN